MDIVVKVAELPVLCHQLHVLVGMSFEQERRSTHDGSSTDINLCNNDVFLKFYSIGAAGGGGGCPARK